MIASVLQEAGFKTGLYTSPHLKDFRERIKVNGEMIPESRVVNFVSSHKKIIESLNPSFFELTVALAFDYFAESMVDIAVVEVGLGGRLDSTNIITPVLSVITNIGHDHMDLLGSTLVKVAAEKAGIIKENIPVIVSEAQPDVKNVFISKASETGSELSFADERFLCVLSDSNESGMERNYTLNELSTGFSQSGQTVLCGDYQSKNIQCVFEVFRFLKKLMKISDIDIMNGISNVIGNTGLYGRWQILGNDPLTICDTGHNKEGLEYVLMQLKRIQKTCLHIVVGFVNDKDLSSVLPLFPVDAVYYFTKASVPRALNEETLQQEALKYGLIGKSFPDVITAFTKARNNAARSDVIFIGGSTFIVADLL